MAAIVRNALVGVGALSATAIGGFAYWVNGKTKDLPADLKGSIFPRMKEVMSFFDKVCESLHFGHMRELLAQTKKQQK
jgi:hypothetical protein